ncbi:hypothetical protein [Teichococcus aestuarii]|uniref:Uncharacterized protein n=1 Tax=Teichococcus aestuarii TaxID=568898 RepID=A0A2U1UY49_9PROT|nr:hypothetical protein [Pseudoroseomonas aestuarii]PWC26588.1 hypothetical protein CR165_22355 [Pseudoroseomonas aestuarii]
MNRNTPPQNLTFTPVTADRLIDVGPLPDASIIGFVGKENGEEHTVRAYGEAFRALNAEARARAQARLPMRRSALDLSKRRVERVTRRFRHMGMTETWENAKPDERFKASTGERLVSIFLMLAGFAGIGVSVSVLTQYLESGPLMSLSGSSRVELLMYGSILFFAAWGSKALAMTFSREAQKRLCLMLGVFGLLCFLGWVGATAYLFQPDASSMSGTATSRLVSTTSSDGTGGGIARVILLALHLAADSALGATVFIASGLVLSKGRIREEKRSSADALGNDMAAEAFYDWESRACELGTDIALAGEAYEAGLQRAIEAGHAHFQRLKRQRDAALALAEYEMLRSIQGAQSGPRREALDS